MDILVTGTAGFIGSHLALRVLERGDEVIGIDNLSDYYDVNLKKTRLAGFVDHPNYTHIHADLADRAAIEADFATHKPQRVENLAAQAGVRYAEPACVRGHQLIGGGRLFGTVLGNRFKGVLIKVRDETDAHAIIGHA